MLSPDAHYSSCHAGLGSNCAYLVRLQANKKREAGFSFCRNKLMTERLFIWTI